MPSKRFGCSSANRREMASWSAASTFRTKRFAAWSAGYMSFLRSTDTRTSGGSSDTDATELAVMPTGRLARGHDGHPGGEATEQLAELSGIDAGHVVTRGIEPGHRLGAPRARGR